MNCARDGTGNFENGTRNGDSVDRADACSENSAPQEALRLHCGSYHYNSRTTYSQPARLPPSELNLTTSGSLGLIRQLKIPASDNPKLQYIEIIVDHRFG